jgi:mRNA interferase ChpB
VTPQRGDILHLAFDPASGTEMKGDHFCLVVSPKTFNQRFKLAWVCPISGGLALAARESGFLISLSGCGTRTDGNIHAHQVKALDWAARKARHVEAAPEWLVEQVLQCMSTVIET